MKTIAKIFIGALVAVGAYVVYTNYKKKKASSSTGAAILPSPASVPTTTSTSTSTPTGTSNAVVQPSSGFVPAATNPASTPIVSAPATTSTAATTTSSSPSAISATTRFNQLIAEGGIQSLAIIPGYGILYYQTGTRRSAKIPEIAAGDQVYINTYQNLINSKGIPKAV